MTNHNLTAIVEAGAKETIYYSSRCYDCREAARKEPCGVEYSQVCRGHAYKRMAKLRATLPRLETYCTTLEAEPYLVNPREVAAVLRKILQCPGSS